MFRPKLPSLNKKRLDNQSFIESSPNASIGLSVPDIVMTYGSTGGIPLNKIPTIPWMLRILYQMKKSYRDVSKNPSNPKKFIDSDTLHELTLYINSLGIDDIGFTKVPKNLIFKDKIVLHENAIVLIMQMSRDKIESSPSRASSNEIMRTYYQLGFAANKISEFLRSKGFSAQAGPAMGGDVSYSPLAESAGLGILGKHGLLIHPQFGPSLRIGAVYTSIENLPIVHNENPNLWLKDFCASCKRCVSKCPSDAIFEEDRVNPNGSKTSCDFTKCGEPFAKNYGCTLCVKNCIFFRGDYEKIKATNEKN